MYRFLLSRRWVGYAAAALAIASGMVLLGNWQWDRYQDRKASNARIEIGGQAPPVAIAEVLPRPSTPGTAGPPPAADQEWAPIEVTGRYDSTREILARGRTVNGALGFEVVTPLLLADGTAVLVDRGWIAAPPGDATARPTVSAAPSGQVTVRGRVHFSESRPRPVQRQDGRLEVRRIAVGQLAPELPYPIFNGYVLLNEQVPAGDPALMAIPIRTENAWQSGAYAVQWWLFAVMVLGWYIWSARRETHRHPQKRQEGDGGLRPALPTTAPYAAHSGA